MRRLIDIIFALTSLILLAPLFLLIALAIRIDSPGNPFYGGLRAGRGGKPFRMWKFRSMVTDADRTGPGITTKQDPRVTRIGALLRKTKLDELPQFFNLLMGDLTLIGPRAEVPHIVQQYSQDQRRVLEFVPGVTGIGAIDYTEKFDQHIPDGPDAERYYIATVLDEKLRLEVEYEQQRSFSTDLGVIYHTARLVLQSILGHTSKAADPK